MKEKELSKIRSALSAGNLSDLELMKLDLALLRYNYFYRFVILELRNIELMNELKRMKQKLGNSRKIFVILGGGHLTDPRFIGEIRVLGSEYALLQSVEAQKLFEGNGVTPFEDMKFMRIQLENRGVQTSEFEQIYQDLRETLLTEGGLTQDHYSSFSQRILFGSSSSGCAKSLDQKPI
jgi:hypothetical protein